MKYQMENEALRKILVVDDDELIRDVCSLVLIEMGYEVETAVHGIEAMERLTGSAYGLVISDLEMPRLGGIGLYRRAVRDYPYLTDRFLFMTGDLSQEARSALSLLNKRCLLKPFKAADLLHHVEMFML